MVGLSRPLFVLGTVAWLSLSACGGDGSGDAKALPFSSIPRVDFNRRAAELYLPLFWREDANNNGALEPNELAFLTGIEDTGTTGWIDESGRFSQAFRTAYGRMSKPDPEPTDAAEQTRQRLIREELAQGRPTLVATDLGQSSEADKNFMGRMLAVAELIERIYARQKGVFGMGADIPESDTASRMVFHRNQSPFCEAPKTENQEACSALAKKPPR